MTRIGFVLLVLTGLFLGSVTSSALAKQTEEEKLTELTNEALRTIQEFDPVAATSKGIHSFDGQLVDYSSRSVKRFTNSLNSYLKQANKIKADQLSSDSQIDLKLLKSLLEVTVYETNTIKWHKQLPQVYVDQIIDGIYLLMIAEHIPMDQRFANLMSRFRAVPQLVATAGANLSRPGPIWIDAAKESLDGAQTFYRETGGELMRLYPDSADEILKVVTAAREAIHDFEVSLTEMRPGADNSFSIGRESFDYLLAHKYFLPIDSDSLLILGEALFEEADQAYHEWQEYMLEHFQNGRDSVFVPKSFTRDDVMDYYQWEVEQTRIFIEENDLMSVPEDIADIRVVQTPAHLRSMIGGIAYQPAGMFDSGQPGVFYVRPLPEQFEGPSRDAFYRYVHRRGFKGSIVHEAYPGHHLQFQVAAHNPKPIRKWFDNMMLSEGWALYCEELMYNSGFYGEEDPAMWLAILGGIRYRAARIIADVKLHTGRYTYQECVDWICEALDAESESDKNYHRKMTRKYTLTPTRWMSYLMGKREITRLADAWLEREGENATLADFHDAFLAEGAVPPALLWQAWDLQRP